MSYSITESCYEFSISQEAKNISQSVKNMISHIQKPLYRVKDIPEEKFNDLLNKWKEETKINSSLTDIITNPNYLKIIGMGEKALPLILEELHKENNFLFSALEAITGEDLIDESLYGNMKLMRQVWLNWGMENGYI